MAKKIEVISTKVKEMGVVKKLSHFLGKKVFTPSGERIGKVSDVATLNGQIVGVIVSGGKPMLIGKEYIGSESEDSLMLNARPVILAVNKTVFDSAGNKLGKVKALVRDNNSNDYSALLVKKGLFSKEFEIPEKNVDVLHKNIILNKEWLERPTKKKEIEE